MQLIQKNSATAAQRQVKVRMLTTAGANLTGTSGLAAQIVKAGSTSYGNIAGSLAECSDGTYNVDLAVGDIDTVGAAMLKIVADDALTQYIPILVVEFNPYDAANFGSTTLGTLATLLAALTPTRAAKLDNLDVAVSTRAVSVGLTDAKLAADGLDECEIDGFTPRELLSLLAAVLIGKASGATGTTMTFKKAVHDDGITFTDEDDRVIATVDANGNRTEVNLNPLGAEGS